MMDYTRIGGPPKLKFKQDPSKEKNFNKIIKKLLKEGKDFCKEKYLCWHVGSLLYDDNDPLLFGLYAKDIKHGCQKVQIASWYHKDDDLKNFHYSPIATKYLDYFFNCGEDETNIIDCFSNSNEIDLSTLFNIVCEDAESGPLYDGRWLIEKIGSKYPEVKTPMNIKSKVDIKPLMDIKSKVDIKPLMDIKSKVDIKPLIDNNTSDVNKYKKTLKGISEYQTKISIDICDKNENEFCLFNYVDKENEIEDIATNFNINDYSVGMYGNLTIHANDYFADVITKAKEKHQEQTEKKERKEQKRKKQEEKKKLEEQERKEQECKKQEEKKKLEEQERKEQERKKQEQGKKELQEHEKKKRKDLERKKQDTLRFEEQEKKKHEERKEQEKKKLEEQKKKKEQEREEQEEKKKFEEQEKKKREEQEKKKKKEEQEKREEQERKQQEEESIVLNKEFLFLSEEFKTMGEKMNIMKSKMTVIEIKINALMDRKV